MTKLERKFKTIAEQLRKRYSFLSDVGIDVCEGYGIAGATAHRPSENAVYLDLKALRKIHNTSRFVKRLGKTRSFSEFVLLILLHEIAHVEQFQTIPEHRLSATLREADYNTNSGHDECWIEQEADQWAVKELRKIKKSRAISI